MWRGWGEVPGTGSPLAPGCEMVCHVSGHGSDPFLTHLRGAALLFPQEARLGELLFFEFMFLIGSNYKGPQGGPGGRERTWAGQRFTASAHHPHLPPAPPQVHVEKCLRPFK